MEFKVFYNNKSIPSLNIQPFIYLELNFLYL